MHSGNIKEIILYDDEHKGELITTLQMYLRNNQSIKKTAGAMFVHYRTISYRLEKIKQIPELILTMQMKCWQSVMV